MGMMALWWTLLPVAGAAFLLGILRGPGRRERERLLAAFTEGIDLPATAEVVALVDRRIRDRSVGQSAGGLAAVLAFALVLLLSPESVPLGVTGLSTMGIIVAAMAAGGGISALRQFPAPRGPDASRVARLDAPTLDDYVHPAWIWASAIGTVAAVCLAVWLFAGAVPNGPLDGGPSVAGIAALAALSLGGVVCAGILSRRLLGIPQPASDERELQWDDGLRAYALRDIWIASIALSSATIVAGSSVTFSATSPGLYFGILIGVAPVVLSTLRASRRPGRRLWRNAGARS